MNFVFETNSHSRQNPSLRSTWLISDQIFYSFYKWALLEIHMCTKDSQNTDLASGPKGKGWISASYLSLKELLPHSSGRFSTWFTFYMRGKPVSLEDFPQSTRVSLKKKTLTNLGHSFANGEVQIFEWNFGAPAPHHSPPAEQMFHLPAISGYFFYLSPF